MAKKQKIKPQLLIITGPQGSGNHLFAKIFASHRSVYGWKLRVDEWQGHHDEPFGIFWKKPELLLKQKPKKKYYVTSISCPYFLNKKPTIPDYKKFIKFATQIFDIKIIIIGRDKNILKQQQKRLRNKHTTPIAKEEFKLLYKYKPLFVSQELFALYGTEYIRSLNNQIQIPLDYSIIDSLKYYNANKNYIKKNKKGLFDKQAHRTSYIES